VVWFTNWSIGPSKRIFTLGVIILVGSDVKAKYQFIGIPVLVKKKHDDNGCQEGCCKSQGWMTVDELVLDINLGQAQKA
jgi:hypothetical protein